MLEGPIALKTPPATPTQARNFAYRISPSLLDKSKPDHADDDQVSGDNEIEQARHQQDSDAGDKRDDGLYMSNTDDHDGSPWVAGSNETAQRAASSARCYPSILEKSATARVASRISLSSLRRFSRKALSSTLTVTFSKKASTAVRSVDKLSIALSKSSFAT